MAHPTRTRRQFLAHTASGFGATWIAAQWPAIAAVHMHAAAATTNPRSLTFGFLTQDEARDVEALAAQIVPSDDTPGAREAGALHFIDRSLHTWAASIADPFRSGCAISRRNSPPGTRTSRSLRPTPRPRSRI